MLPQKGDQRWIKLVKGEIRHNFKSVPGGLMVSRLNRQVSSGWGNRTAEQCVDELYGFFEKYESILQDDITAIFN